MKSGCFGKLFFTFLFLACFGLSSYFWFTYFVRGRSVATPQLAGKTIADARAICSDRGVILIVDNTQDRSSNDVATGAVVWQNRAAGSLIKRGTRLLVGQSLGPTILSVPDLKGQSARTALLRFSQRNLRLGALAYVDTGGKGIVAEDPPAGTVVAGQSAVSLLVAVDPTPARYVMPDVIDRHLNAVRPTLEVHGFAVGNVRFESYPGIPDGTIIRQFPIAGSAVTAHDTITLVVAQNEATPTTVPPPPPPVTPPS
jgi:eukaryotic-like serine/threonine-protein kinase